jgi:Mg-chelatase subunit ChlD
MSIVSKDFRVRSSTIALAIVLGALAGLGGLAPDASVSAAPAAQRGGDSVCSCTMSKRVAPDTIELCETSQVEIGISPECPGTPIHIVLIIDEVYKPNYSEPRDRTQALRKSVQRLEMRAHPNVRVGVVWMQKGRAIKKLDLSNDASKVITNLNVPPLSRFSAKVQCFDCGFREAVKIMDRGQKDYPDADIHEIFLLAPLGVYTAEAVPSVTKGARLAKARRAAVISTCFAWTHCDAVLRKAASQPRLYLKYGEGNRLAALLDDVVHEASSAFIRTVELVDTYPPEMEVLTDSFSVAPASIDTVARTITWEFKKPIQEFYSLTYQVKPLALGAFEMGDEDAKLKMVDSQYAEFDLQVPAPVLTVSKECPLSDTPTPLPTNTPLPTPTPPATRIPTIAPTPTPLPPTATPEPTKVPLPLYLPIMINELCVPARTHTDVALVMDLSSSMLERGEDGRPKVEALQEAALRFLDGMHLQMDAAGGSDRVAVVGFNERAWILQPMTNDEAMLRNAVGALRDGVREYTRLDLAFERGADALAASPNPESAPVMVLFTDGQPNRVPMAEDGHVETTVLRSAAAAKNAGVTVYTVSVGRAVGADPEVNAALMREAASAPHQYYSAPDAGKLASIYSTLTEVIPCGGARYWPANPK